MAEMPCVLVTVFVQDRQIGRYEIEGETCVPDFDEALLASVRRLTLTFKHKVPSQSMQAAE